MADSSNVSQGDSQNASNVRKSQAEKTALRNEYRQLYAELLEKESDDGTELKDLKVLLERNDRLYQQASEIQEITEDAKVLRRISEMCKAKVEGLNANAGEFKQSVFAEKLVSCMRGVQLNEQEFFVPAKCWIKLGKECQSLFQRSPSLSYLYGSLRTDPPERKEPKTRERQTQQTKMADLRNTQIVEKSVGKTISVAAPVIIQQYTQRILCYGSENAVRVAARLKKCTPSNWIVEGVNEHWASLAALTDNVRSINPFGKSMPGDIILLDVVSDFVYHDSSSAPLTNLDHMKVLGIVTCLSAEARVFLEKVHDLVKQIDKQAIIFILTPFPRYVKAKCCQKKSHMTNWTARFVMERIMPMTRDFEVVIKFNFGSLANVFVIGPSDLVSGDPSTLTNVFHFGLITENDSKTLTEQGITKLARLMHYYALSGVL